VLAQHIDANSWDVAVMISRLSVNDKLKFTSSGVYDFCMRARTHFLPNSDTFSIGLR